MEKVTDESSEQPPVTPSGNGAKACPAEISAGADCAVANNGETDKNFYNKVLEVATDVGGGLLSCGCPVARVEMAVDYMCKAYGADEVNVSVMPNMIIADVKLADGSGFSQMKRIYSTSNNFAKMEAYNQLSRDITKRKYTVGEARARVEDIASKYNPGRLMTALSGGIGAGAFTVFYGGSLIDAVPAALVGGLMAFLSCVLSNMAFNSYARTFILSLIGGVLSTLLCWIIRLTGLPCNLSTVMMGTIMIVIPGLLLCNAVRDLFSGDIYSGSFEVLNAVITTLAIVAGYGLSLATLNVIVDNAEAPARSGELAYYLYRIISCLIGTTAFTLFFGSSVKKLLPSEINAMVTFSVWLIMEKFVVLPTNYKILLDMLVATIVAAVISEVFARVFKAPATIFFVPGVIIFVPGRSLYLAVSNIISGDASAAISWGEEMGLLIVGIVVGLIVVTLFFQFVHPTRLRKHLRRKVKKEKEKR